MRIQWYKFQCVGMNVNKMTVWLVLQQSFTSHNLKHSPSQPLGHCGSTAYGIHDSTEVLDDAARTSEPCWIHCVWVHNGSEVIGERCPVRVQYFRSNVENWWEVKYWKCLCDDQYLIERSVCMMSLWSLSPQPHSPIPPNPTPLSPQPHSPIPQLNFSFPWLFWIYIYEYYRLQQKSSVKRKDKKFFFVLIQSPFSLPRQDCLWWNPPCHCKF